MASAQKGSQTLTREDMLTTLDQKQKELVLLRFKLAANQLKDVSLIKKTRREIARINTVLNKNK